MKMGKIEIGDLIAFEFAHGTKTIYAVILGIKSSLYYGLTESGSYSWAVTTERAIELANNFIKDNGGLPSDNQLEDYSKFGYLSLDSYKINGRIVQKKVLETKEKVTGKPKKELYFSPFSGKWV